MIKENIYTEKINDLLGRYIDLFSKYPERKNVTEVNAAFKKLSILNRDVKLHNKTGTQIKPILEDIEMIILKEEIFYV